MHAKIRANIKIKTKCTKLLKINKKLLTKNKPINRKNKKMKIVNNIEKAKLLIKILILKNI